MACGRTSVGETTAVPYRWKLDDKCGKLYKSSTCKGKSMTGLKK